MMDSQRYYVVPEDPKTREFLLAVDRRTKGDVEKRFNIHIDHDWYCNTIADQTVEAIITSLKMDTIADNAVKMINFYNMFSAKVSLKVNENAEKEGNVNISFEPGVDAIALISDPIPENEKEYVVQTAEEAFALEEVPDDVIQAYDRLDAFARYSLSANFGITISSKLHKLCTAVTYVFFENIFRGLLHELAEDPDAGIAKLNFNDLIEMHASFKDGGVILTMRPGAFGKLTIKSDNFGNKED